MKPSSRPVRTPSKLSAALHHQLNGYTLAASAAGVGVLALANAAEAKIIYTPAHIVIGENEQYNLAVNNKTTDFVIYNHQCLEGPSCNSTNLAYLRVWPATKSNGAVASSGGWAAALRRGEPISKKRTFGGYGFMVTEWVPLYGTIHSGTFGPWANVSKRYLGLKFKIKGKYHYGWARFNVGVPYRQFVINAVVTGYAYETIPNKAIIAGKTRGPDVVTMPLDAGTLGRLALGRK